MKKHIIIYLCSILLLVSCFNPSRKLVGVWEGHDVGGNIMITQFNKDGTYRSLIPGPEYVKYEELGTYRVEDGEVYIEITKIIDWEKDALHTTQNISSTPKLRTYTYRISGEFLSLADVTLKKSDESDIPPIDPSKIIDEKKVAKESKKAKETFPGTYYFSYEWNLWVMDVTDNNISIHRNISIPTYADQDYKDKRDWKGSWKVSEYYPYNNRMVDITLSESIGKKSWDEIKTLGVTHDSLCSIDGDRLEYMSKLFTKNDYESAKDNYLRIFNGKHFEIDGYTYSEFSVDFKNEQASFNIQQDRYSSNSRFTGKCTPVFYPSYLSEVTNIDDWCMMVVLESNRPTRSNGWGGSERILNDTMWCWLKKEYYSSSNKKYITIDGNDYTFHFKDTWSLNNSIDH